MYKNTLLFFAFAFLQNLYGNEAYYFQVNSEGIYKIKVPGDLVKSNIFLSFNKYTYEVFKDSKYAYVFCPKKGIYQISSSKSHLSKVNNIIFKDVIKTKKYYRYSLPNSMNTSHWFLDIVSENKVFERKIYKGISKKYDEIYVKIKLYNFKNSKAPILVEINGKEKHYTLNYNGDKTILVPITSSKKYFNIKITSFFHDVGIESISIDSSKDKKILHENKFEKYVFTEKQKINELYKNYSYGTIIDNKFIKVEKGLSVSNLVIQKTDSIEEIKIFPAPLAKEDLTDFIIVYNSTIFNNKDLNALNKLLNKINPKLGYKFIDAQHIYNSYSISEPSSIAIKKYLHKINPKYVLFLGDASDREDENNIIPTFYYIQDKDFTRIETDYIYTYINNPENPKFSIGRLPFKTSSELSFFIQKVLKFLELQEQKKYIIYDDISLIKNPLSVKYTSYEKQNSLKKYLGLNTIPDYINSEKPTLFQFIGHASYSGWSNNKKVNIDDMNSINIGNLFLVLDLSCWTGTFSHYKKNCFAEDLIKMKDKGSVTSISASGYTKINNYENITEYFIKNRGNEIGLTLTKMKKELFNKNKISIDDIHAYNLLGIPTLEY